ncbi:Stress-associated endoplasmic reticulum protein [Abortiporus biennis]
MPTEFELRKRNAQFAEKARAGKNPVNTSRQEKLAKRSPISLWALGAVLFVVLGGVLFELLRIIFL